MNYTFNNSSIVSVNSGTIVLNVSGKTRTFVDAKLVSAIDGKIVLDLPEPSFKKGTYITLVTNKGKEVTFILSKNTDIRTYYYVSTHPLGLAYSDFWFKSNNNFRSATPEEIQELNDQLKVKGKCWNSDTMRIEKFQWKPQYGDGYYRIAFDHGKWAIFNIRWSGLIMDINSWQDGNCFQTKEEAEAKLVQIKEILNSII